MTPAHEQPPAPRRHLRLQDEFPPLKIAITKTAPVYSDSESSVIRPSSVPEDKHIPQQDDSFSTPFPDEPAIGDIFVVDTGLLVVMDDDWKSKFTKALRKRDTLLRVASNPNDRATRKNTTRERKCEYIVVKLLYNYAKESYKAALRAYIQAEENSKDPEDDEWVMISKHRKIGLT
ncbi:hypothetical protein AOQ84DRAFT_362885 [Glonium stellatum]|uniref:Uncharacterized protein n=1 Tax=Glonium stellatum TaxID=574774 RepID=A0A8E2F3F5_9PEZI|nr:hypothetical protein AOQ84DRAFT_362885 [Glonium stellatum]